jgi:hypothetical protein
MQEVQDLAMPRRVCFNRNGIITYPFIETTGSATGDAPAGNGVMSSASAKNCNPTVAQSPTRAMVGSWQRTVWFQDGVIDITLEGPSNDFYRIKTPFVTQFTNNLRANVYQIQNDNIRMTIVGHPHLRMSVVDRATLEFRTSQGINIVEPLRIRIIMEEVDNFHVGAESIQNHFGAFMIDEFDHPLQCSKSTVHKDTNGISNG